MAVKPPSLEDLARLSDSFGMRLSREQLQQFKQILDPMVATYDRLDQLKEPELAVKYPDRRNWKPTDKENPLGAWYWMCDIARNPHDLSRSPGGSSTGSGALVAAGYVDVAIGADQAGSIRIPCAWSGIYGLKPSYGLVPYTGIGPMELTIDHTGPMARSARDTALLLEAIAGPDGLDPRQRAGLMPQKYSAALTGDIKGLRLGIVKEGFGRTEPVRSEKDVDDAVREAAHALARHGAQVREISVPMHPDGFHIWSGIAGEIVGFMIESGGAGKFWKGYYPTEMIETFSRAVAAHGEYLSDSA